MGEVSAARVYTFAARLRALGPQPAIIGGVRYLCHAPITGRNDGFVATTHDDYRVFRLMLAAQEVKVIEADRVPIGEMLSTDRHTHVLRVVQRAAEAWLRDQAKNKGVEFYVHYLVHVLVGTGLMMADQLSDDLIAILRSEAVIEVAARIDDYKRDPSGSLRLRSAWIEGIVTLTQLALTRCPD